MNAKARDIQSNASRKRALLLGGTAFCLAALLGGLILYQFQRLGNLQSSGPESTARRIKPNVPPRGPRVKDVAAKEASPDVPDLQGEREPTEEELIRYSILRYLAEIRAASGNNIDKVLAYPRNKAELEELLRSLPPEAVPIIADLLRREKDFLCRRLLIYGLADIGTNEAAAVLRQYFLEHISDPSYGSEMRHLIRALGRCRAEYAFQSLKDFLFDQENPAVRELRPHYVEAMGKHRLGYQAVPLFMDLVKTDYNDLVRNKAAQAVKNVAKREAIPARSTLAQLKESFALEKARQSEREKPVPYVEQTILGAAGQLGDPAAVPWLLEVGTTEPLPVRLSAAAALARIGGPEAVAALKEVYASCDQKEKLVKAISLLREPQAAPFLADVVVSAEKETVRKAALQGLSRLGGTAALEAFQQILNTEGLPESVRNEVQNRMARLVGSRP